MEKQSPNKPKRIVVLSGFSVLTIIVLVLINCLSTSLHGDNQIAYDLISSNSFFSQAVDIEVVSGYVTTSKTTGENIAYLQINFTDRNTNFVSGCYKIQKDSVLDILKSLEVSTNPNESRALRLNREACLENDRLDYALINAELNKQQH